MAEHALGQPFFNEEAIPVDSSDHARELIYKGALRAIARQRHTDRQTNAESFDADSWHPNEEQTASLREHLEPYSGRLAMIRNVEAAADHLKTNAQSFLTHQVVPYENTLDFIRTMPHNARFPEFGELGLRGRIEASTGTGKTFVMAKTAEAMGLEHALGIVSVPRVGLIKQVKAEFNKYTPNMPVSMQSRQLDARDIPKGIHIVTHARLFQLYKEGLLPLPDLQAVFLDEVHMLLGQKMRAICQSLGNTVVLGYTGSAELLHDHVKSLLPHRIFEDDLRGCIEGGILRAVQLLPVATGQVLRPCKVGHREYTGSDLSELASNKERNEYIVTLAKYFVELGLPTYISCIPGNHCAHAHLLADAMSKQKIVDKNSGKERQIVAAAVDGTMLRADLEAIKSKWERGEIDTISDVKLLAMGWNTARIGAIILASPTTSPATQLQRIGRGLRFNPDFDRVIIAELIDKAIGRGARRPITCWDLFEEETFEVGKIIGPVGTNKAWGSRELPPLIEAAANELEFQLVDMHMVGGLKEYEAIPPDWVLLSEVLELAGITDMDISDRSLRILLREEANLLCRHAGKDQARYYAPPEAVDFMKTYKPVGLAPAGYATTKQISELGAWDIGIVRRTIREIGAEGEPYRLRQKRRRVPHYSLKEQARIIIELEKDEARPGEVFHIDIMRDVGVSYHELATFLANAGIKGSIRKGKLAYPTIAEELARNEYLEKVIPETATILQDLAAEYNIPRSSLDKIIRRESFEPYIKMGHVKGSGREKHYVEADIANALRDILPPLGSVQVQPFARQLGVNEGIVMALVEVNEWQEYIHSLWDGRRYTYSIKADILTKLEKAVKSYKQGTRRLARRQARSVLQLEPRPASIYGLEIERLVPAQNLLTELKCTSNTLRGILVRCHIPNAMAQYESTWYTHQIFANRIRNYAAHLPFAPNGWLPFDDAAGRLGVDATFFKQRLSNSPDSVQLYKDKASDVIDYYVAAPFILQVAHELRKKPHTS